MEDGIVWDTASAVFAGTVAVVLAVEALIAEVLVRISGGKYIQRAKFTLKHRGMEVGVALIGRQR